MTLTWHDAKLVVADSQRTTGPSYKFYQAGIVHDPSDGKWHVLFNWGTGSGSSGPRAMNDGQLQYAGGFATESAARAQMNKKVLQKTSKGYVNDPWARLTRGETVASRVVTKIRQVQQIQTGPQRVRPLTPTAPAVTFKKGDRVRFQPTSEVGPFDGTITNPELIYDDGHWRVEVKLDKASHPFRDRLLVSTLTLIPDPDVLDATAQVLAVETLDSIWLPYAMGVMEGLRIKRRQLLDQLDGVDAEMELIDAKIRASIT